MVRVFNRNILGFAPAALLAAVALWIAADSVGAVARTYTAFPFWDLWRILADYQAWTEGFFALADLFRQHNEHRFPVGRLIFFADFHVFQGRGIFPLAATLAVQALHAALLVWIALRHARSPLALAAGALTIAGAFTLVAHENLIWSFQTPFVLIYAAATLAFYLVARAALADREGEGGVAAPLAGAVAAIAVAVGCMANGLVAGVLAVVLAVFLGASRRVVVPLTAAVLALTFAYLKGFKAAAPGGGLAFALEHPGAMLKYGLMFLGNLLRDYPDPYPKAQALGAVGVLLCLGMAWRILVRRDRDVGRLTMAAVVVFVASAAVLSGLARVPQFGVGQAFAPRYVTPGALFWTAQGLFWTSAALEARSRWRQAPVWLGLASLLGLMAYAQALTLPAMAGLQARMAWAEDAVLSRVTDPEAFAGGSETPALLPAQADFLRAKGLSVFATGKGHAYGQRIGELSEAAACAGFMDSATPIPKSAAGVRIAGWAWDRGARRPVRQVVATDAGGRVVGFATGGGFRPDVPDALPEVTRQDAGWRGFANVAPGAPIRVYALLADGRACELSAP